MAIYGNMVVPSKPGGGLPTSNAGGEIYAPGQGVSGRLSDAGIQLAAQAGQIQGQAEKQAGESWGNLGKGLQKLGGFGMIMASREARLDMAKAQEAVSRLQIEGIEERTRLSRLHGAGAVGADGKSLDVEEQWRNWYTQAKARHGEGLGEYGKRYFDLHADTYNVQQQAWAAQYAEQQLGRFQDQQLAFAVDAEASVIGQDPTNAQVVSGSLGRIFALIDQKGQRMGWTPDMAQQAKQAAAGQAMGNAMLQQMQLGRPDVAQALFGQYGHLLSQAQYVQVFQAYQQALLAQGKIDMQSNNWRGIGQLGGQSSRPLDMHIEAATSRKAGTPYAYGTMRDCSGHTCEMWQQAPIDPAVRERIFGKPGAHITSDEIIARAAKETGHMFRGAEITPQTVGGGWVIGVSTGKAGREEGISHIVTTFVNSQGVLMVSEASRQGIHSETFAGWYKRYKPEQLRGVNLTSLMAGGTPHPTPGAPAGGTPAGYQEYTKERGGSIAETHHNPGNIRHNGKDYDYYQSDADGWRDMAAVLRKPGYQNLTVRQIAERYVTGHVGGKVVDSYLQAIQKQDFSLDEKPNLQDPMVLARLMKGMAVGESPLGQKYTVEQIHALVAAGGQGAGPMKGGAPAPAQGGMPMMQGGPGMGRGLYASPETVAALGQMQGTARARSMGQWYNAEIEAGRMTYGEAMQQAQLIQDDKLRAGVRTELTQSNSIRQTLEREKFDKATEEMGQAVAAIQKRFDGGDQAGALKELFDLMKSTQTESIANPQDKNLRRKLKVYEDAYKAMSGGRSIATDPEAFNQLTQGIADGTITSEAQLAKAPAYATMSSKDKNELKGLIKTLQKVDAKTLDALFNEIIGSPQDPDIDKTERQRRNALRKQLTLDVTRMARETNLGSNEEWLRKQVSRLAEEAVRPGMIWDSETTLGDERIGEAKGDYLPKATTGEMAFAQNALATLFDMQDAEGAKPAQAYRAAAKQWKEKHSAFASEEQVMALLFVRSQREAMARGGRSPARAKGVPESAEWTAHPKLGWGWKWRQQGKSFFEPYIYSANKEG